jgi:6-phosphofructokinase 1
VVDSVLAVRARDDGHKVIAIKAGGIDTPTDRLKDLVDSQLARRSDIPPTEIETRVTVLGHAVRGGRPSAFDRLLGSRMGNVAPAHWLRGATARWLPGSRRSMRSTESASAPRPIPTAT